MTALSKTLSKKYGIKVIDHSTELTHINEDCDTCFGLGRKELFRGQFEDTVCEVINCPECAILSEAVNSKN